MTPEQTKRISKFLSLHLRHQPEGLGLTLAPGGWAPVQDVLRGCAEKRFPITFEQLEEVVLKNDKQRFRFDETKQHIRASQGHSVEVDLQLSPTVPPDTLYHGTTEKNLEAILKDGLVKMSRHHVHLSRDEETAVKVGGRHGRPIVLIVAAGAMRAAGYVFFVSDNGVWLTEEVPSHYLMRQ